jgi:tetratricopeptide (TPR) repeat protein
MTSPASLEARKQIALGWSRIKLDPAAALKNFEAAITADPMNAAVRVQRSQARLAAGDFPGALGDSDDAIRMDPRLGEAYAARAEAKRALGRAEAELVSDYETAANLDGRFTEAYKAVAARLSAAPSASASGANADWEAYGRSAPDGPLGLLARSPKKWGLIALLCVLAALAGGLFAPLLLKRRRSPDAGAPTPRP